MPRRARTFDTLSATCLALLCGALACDGAPPPRPATPPVVALPTPSASAAAPVENGPLVVERPATKAAPWLEPASEPLPLWVTSVKPHGGAQLMVDPVLRDTKAIAAETSLLVIRTAAGDLLRRPDGYVGVVPRGLSFVGLTRSGKLILSREGGDDVVAASLQDAVQGKTAPATWSGRAIDASGAFVLTLGRDGKLARSKDEGATFTPVDGLGAGAPTRGWIRFDGVALVEIASRPENDRYFLIDASGKARPVGRALKSPGRLGGLIHANETRYARTDDITGIEVLATDGRTWNHMVPPPAFEGASFVTFHPLFLTAPTADTGRDWPGIVLAAPPAPQPKPKPKRATSDRDVYSVGLGSVDKYAMAGIIGTIDEGSIGAPDPKKTCKGLLCFAQHRPLLRREVGSKLGARFFDDGVCAGSGTVPKCPPDTLVQKPMVGFFRPNEGLVGFVRAPADCAVPEHAWSARGLVIVDCQDRRFVADATMGPKTGGFRLLPETPPPAGTDGDWEPQMASDGTLLVASRKEGLLRAVQVRRPDAAGAPGAWRSLVLGDGGLTAIEAFPLEGNAALLALTNGAGDRLTLVLDDAGAQTVLVRDVKVERRVMRIFFEGGLVILGYADEETPRASTVYRNGTLQPYEPRRDPPAGGP